MKIVIRNETEADTEAISEITKAAFDNLAISDHTEQFIIDALRDGKALAISLVAADGNRVVGHIAFSPVKISDGSPGWYGLGPISVLPELQKQGIGRSLMREGLARLRSLGAKGCILVGDPGYYERFGFRSPKDLVVEGVPQQFVLALPFEDSRASGNAIFHDAFAATG
ncbi:MAG: Acetyltransferase (GNAT) family protein [Methanosaeta sp. PtaU1.Bin112]|nr:MAG: Acetyltransferase (GNAT) family protein [Methanosaeta sp. PtaU1.Bin112]